MELLYIYIYNEQRVLNMKHSDNDDHSTVCAYMYTCTYNILNKVQVYVRNIVKTYSRNFTVLCVVAVCLFFFSIVLIPN